MVCVATLSFCPFTKAANIPVLVVSFRYDEKVMSLDGYLDLSGDFEDVQARLQAHYGTIKGRYHAGYYLPVDLVGLYWHLVDLIWIFLFPLLYLVP